MNKVYKVVWNKARNCYVVASELAKRKTKSPKSGVFNKTLVAGILASVLSFSTIASVDAATNYQSLSAAGINQNSSGSYTGTVTQDGFLILSVLASDDNHTSVTVNGKSIISMWGGGYFAAENTITVPVVAGDVVTVNTAGRADLLQHGYFVTGGLSRTEIETEVKRLAENGIIGSGKSIKDMTVSGNKINYTRSDGTTGSTTLPYSAGNGLSLSGTTFSAKAGTNVTVNNNGINVVGNGTVADDNTGLIDGGKLYTEVRPSVDGNYIKQSRTTATNLSALDTALADVVDRTHFYGVNSSNSADLNYNGGGATGLDSIAIGATSRALGKNSIAIGKDSFVKEDNAVSFGHLRNDYIEVDENGYGIPLYDSNYLPRITRIGDGVNPYDAATFGQMSRADGDLSNRIGSITVDGSIIKKSATNNVSKNLVALDGVVGTSVANITVDGNMLNIYKNNNTSVSVALPTGGSGSGSSSSPVPSGLSDVTTVGSVTAFASNFTPKGYLLCDGRAVSRTTYAALFKKIGTTYGAGDGKTTFNLPNLVNRFVEGSNVSGQYIQAGLPNITGRVGALGEEETPDWTTGAFYQNWDELVPGDDWGVDYMVYMDASRSSPVYGRSDTVQPESLKMQYYIKIDDDYTGSRYIGVNSTPGGANEFGDGAKGTDAIAIGKGVGVTGNTAIGIGYNNTSKKQDVISIGRANSINSTGMIAVGNDLTAQDNVYSSILVGNKAKIGHKAGTAATDNTIIGDAAEGYGTNITAVGAHAYAGNADGVSNATVVGQHARALANGTVVVGAGIESDGPATSDMGATLASGAQSTVVGFSSQVTGDRSSGFGSNVSISGNDSVGLGSQTRISAADSVAVGNNASVSAQNGVAIGQNAAVAGVNSIAIGRNNFASGESIVSIGRNNTVTGERNVVLGLDRNVSGSYNVALGQAVVAPEVSNTVAMGRGASVSANDGLAVGTGSSAEGGIAIGKGGKSTGDESIALGRNAVADGFDSLAVGHGAVANQAHALILGSFDDAVSDGGATGYASTAVGYNTVASVDNSVALGAESVTDEVVSTEGLTVNGTDYTYAGGTASGTVSIGNQNEDGLYRTLTNVAAGRVAADSTDAINGSQLYAVVHEIGDVTDGNIVLRKNTVGENLSAIDTKIGSIDNSTVHTVKSENTLSENLTLLDSAIGEVKDGYFADSKASLGENIGLLDTAIGHPVNGSYIRQNRSTNTNLAILDTHVANNAQAIEDLKNLYNITDTGVDTIRTISKGAVKVLAGDNIFVADEEDASGNISYTVSAVANGKAEEGDTGLVSGDTLYKAIEDISDSTDTALAAKANVDASNVTDADAWGQKIATGTVSPGDVRAVNGNTLFEELRPSTTGSYVSQDKTTAENLSSLDAGLTDLSDRLSNLDNLSDTGKTTIKELAKEAVTIDSGDHITVNKITDENGVDHYNVSVNANGKVQKDNNELITGGAVYSALQDMSDGLFDIDENKANTDLDNLTDAGKETIRSLSQDAVEVRGGISAEVIKAMEGGKAIYTVNVVPDGVVSEGDTRAVSADAVYKYIENYGGDNKVEEGATGLVTGGAVYDALKDVESNAAHIHADNIGENYNGTAAEKVANAEEWGRALGTGTPALGDNRLVRGDTVYRYVEGSRLVRTDGETVRVDPYGTATAIDFSGPDGSRVLRGVKTDLDDATSVANVGYVDAMVGYVANRGDAQISRLNDKVNKGLANAAALAGLHPVDMDDDQKWNISAALGGYRGDQAGAVGVFYKPQSDVLLSASASFGSDENLYNVGVSFAVDKRDTPRVSKKEMIKVINHQADEIVKLKKQTSEIDALKKQMLVMAAMIKKQGINN